MGWSLNVQQEKILEPVVPWEDITCLLWHRQMLFTTITSNYSNTASGCNGKISIWDKDFNPVGDFKAHDYGIYCMCAGPDNTIYSCASDSIICHWKCDNSPTGKVEVVCVSQLKGHLEPAWKMQFVNKRNLLFSGDELGEIRLWENDVYKGVLETYEEIWDIIVIPKFIFTTRNRDVTVTTIPEDGLKKACSVKNQFPGRGPLFISGDKLLCLNRNSYDIMVHSISENSNPLITTMKGHNYLVTGFVGSDSILFSGDYEGKIFAWDLQELKQVAVINLSGNGCINAMAYYPVEETLYIAQEHKALSKLTLIQD